MICVHRGPAQVTVAVWRLLGQVSRGHGQAVAKCKFAGVHLRVWQPRLEGRVGREETRVEISCATNRLCARSVEGQARGAPASYEAPPPPCSGRGRVPAPQPPSVRPQSCFRGWGWGTGIGW